MIEIDEEIIETVALLRDLVVNHPRDLIKGVLLAALTAFMFFMMILAGPSGYEGRTHPCVQSSSECSE